jgi:predicted amidohydrolase YtcJ
MLQNNAYITELAKRCHEFGFQLNTHCIGDSAVRNLLKIYGEVLQGKNDRRWRIEHCQVVHPDDIALFGKFNIIPSVQPTHATSDMYWAGERLGDERIKTAYAFNDLMKQNNLIAFGTDFPVEKINPLYTFYAAVARKDLKGFPEGGFHPENKVSRADALRAMTTWAAYAGFEEKEKGMIAPGMSADFIILSDDLMTAVEEKIPGIKVLATYVGGEKVFGK